MYTKPTADIAVNGNRLKKYSGKEIYLKDRTEFQIELQNPTQDVYKAMIELNGKLISSAGIVLNPGQHFYLDRFIDENKKFIFETYDVSDTKAAKKAIQKNGLVKILFYREKSNTDFNKMYIEYEKLRDVPQRNPRKKGLWETTPWQWGPDYTGRPYFDSISYSSANEHEGVVTSNFVSLRPSGSKGRSGPEGRNGHPGVMGVRGTEKSIETGRVEGGEESDQHFSEVYKDFEQTCTASYTYYLIPISAQVHTIKDIRSYCGQCGTRIRRKAKFCTECGIRA